MPNLQKWNELLHCVQTAFRGRNYKNQNKSRLLLSLKRENVGILFLFIPVYFTVIFKLHVLHDHLCGTISLQDIHVRFVFFCFYLQSLCILVVRNRDFENMLRLVRAINICGPITTLTVKTRKSNSCLWKWATETGP